MQKLHFYDMLCVSSDISLRLVVCSGSLRIVCQLARISFLIDGSVLNPTAALLNISVSALFSQIQNKNIF